MPRRSACAIRPASPRCSIATTSCSSACSEFCLLSTLIELVAMTCRAGAAVCRDNHCANASRGPKLAIACQSGDGTLSSAAARSPHSHCTPSCAGCGCRLTACTRPMRLHQARQQEPADLAGGSGNEDGHRHSVGMLRGVATIAVPPAAAGSGRRHPDVAQALPQLLVLAAGRADAKLARLLERAFGKATSPLPNRSLPIAIQRCARRWRAAGRPPAVGANVCQACRQAPAACTRFCRRLSSNNGDWQAAGARLRPSPVNRAVPAPVLREGHRMRCAPEG